MLSPFHLITVISSTSMSMGLVASTPTYYTASWLKLENETRSEAWNRRKQFLVYFKLFLIILGHV